MSVTVRAYTRKGRTDWEVDINVLLPNGERFRERRKSPASSKSASQRWGEDRERELLRAGPRQDKKEVPTLGEFASRFLDEHARANQQKPSGIAAKESILRVHLISWLGSKRLDAITTPDVQALKRHLATRSPKTVNDTLTVLNTMLKKAVEWEVIPRVPCSIRLLPTPRAAMGFYTFDQYARLVAAATAIDSTTAVLVLLGGDAVRGNAGWNGVTWTSTRGSCACSVPSGGDT